MSLQEILEVDTGRRKHQRVGRGSGSGIGKTCGRGQKGAGARSGTKVIPYALFEGGQCPLHMHLPRRGFSNFAHRKSYQPISLATAVERVDGDITLDSLIGAGLANKGERIKLVSGSKLDAGVKVEVHKVTKSVREAIEAAGGSVVELDA